MEQPQYCITEISLGLVVESF
ncbi:hypothetical protein EMIT048CA2_10471 [Pseudomonas chlororaphis]